MRTRHVSLESLVAWWNLRARWKGLHHLPTPTLTVIFSPAPFLPKRLIDCPPFTSKSDQYQISPAASPETHHHTAWRTWLFVAYSEDEYTVERHECDINYLLTEREVCTEKISPEILTVRTEPLRRGLYGQDRGRNFLRTDRANSVNKSFIIYQSHSSYEIQKLVLTCAFCKRGASWELISQCWFARTDGRSVNNCILCFIDEWSMNEWSKFPSTLQVSPPWIVRRKTQRYNTTDSHHITDTFSLEVGRMYFLSLGFSTLWTKQMCRARKSSFDSRIRVYPLPDKFSNRSVISWIPAIVLTHRYKSSQRQLFFEISVLRTLPSWDT